MEVYNQIKKDIGRFLFVVVGAIIIIWAFNIGYDVTDDKENSKRSGLRYYKDYGTGIEYISDGNTLIPRSII